MVSQEVYLPSPFPQPLGCASPGWRLGFAFQRGLFPRAHCSASVKEPGTSDHIGGCKPVASVLCLEELNLKVLAGNVPIGKTVLAGEPQHALVGARFSRHLRTQKEKGGAHLQMSCLAPGCLSEKQLSDLTEPHTNISTAFQSPVNLFLLC